MKIIIIGSGLAGLAAGYQLCSSNEVLVFEKDKDIGGMAASYRMEGPKNPYFIEKYYHHIFQSDSELLALLAELGLKSRMQWIKGPTAYFVDGKVHPMNTPLEILRFPPLSIFDLFRLGLMVLRIKMIRDSTSYDKIRAADWIKEIAGKSVYENFFAPLLQSKFGANADKVSAAWLIGRVKIRSNRGKDGEKLGYMKGGFNALLEALVEKIEAEGGKIRTDSPVTEIVIEDGKVQGIRTAGEFIACDAVISTVEPEALDTLTKSGLALHETLENINYQGTACLLLGLKKKLMEDGTYWLNIKAEVPFGAVIEHTNFLPLEDYGEHLVYITAYFQDENDPLWIRDENALTKAYLAGLEKMFPAFSRKDVLWTKLYRRKDTAPVYETGYLKKVLPLAPGISGLYLAGMFSPANYPERSLNGSVLAGFECARSLEEKEKSTAPR